MSFGQFIALASFVLSMGTIAVTYFVGTSAGTAELCNPFFDGCTDITHTGMKGDAGFIFRGGMIAACAFFVIWWQVYRVWLSPYSGRVALGSMQFFGGCGWSVGRYGRVAAREIRYPLGDTRARCQSVFSGDVDCTYDRVHSDL